MEIGESKSVAKVIGDLISNLALTATDGGSTKATGVTNERSFSWQQDIAQAINPDIPRSCPQSM